MELTNAVMWESIQVLKDCQEKGKLGYACARNLRKLMEECREYMHIRDRLLDKYGTNDGMGHYTFEGDRAKAFAQELMDYATISHDVDVMLLDEETFYSGSLTAKEMFTLGWMVKEAENKDEKPERPYIADTAGSVGSDKEDSNVSGSNA